MYDIWYLCLVFRRFFGILIINCAVVALCHRTLRNYWCSTKRESTNNIFRRGFLYRHCNGPHILMEQIFWWKSKMCFEVWIFCSGTSCEKPDKPVIVPYTLQLKHQQIIKLIDCLSYQKFVPLLRFYLLCVKVVNTATVYSHHVSTISKTSFVRTAFYIQKLASFVKEVHMNLVEVANSVNNVFAVGDL
mgnify:CR=1 FL=1